ncbi:luciferase-like monooxygenase [Allonocardiopsis opalescens]|uniref:Luciferase-like monooxygenase n=1 Tax=Allonocardiopsis opalescens TaxID=1144618 RepID=A0A2T0PY21_9ACTN|nr:luciferase-like monooxygenase [Allonocardiopsis opalescens]
MVAAPAAREVPGIEVGTAVVPTYPRHPLALAGQVLTARAVSGNAFTLGVGPSHREIVEAAFGLCYERPARHVREYLSALVPLLRGEEVEYRGETLAAAGATDLVVSPIGDEQPWTSSAADDARDGRRPRSAPHRGADRGLAGALGAPGRPGVGQERGEQPRHRRVGEGQALAEGGVADAVGALARRRRRGDGDQAEPALQR